MRKLLPVAMIAALFVAGCSSEEDVTVEVTEPAVWGDFAESVVAEYYARNPETAVNAGLHEYDGQMSDQSLEAQAEYAEWLEGVISGAMSYDHLTGVEAFERDYLIAQMRSDLFWLRDTNYSTKNPATYFTTSVSVYTDREYAPIDVRIKGYTAYVAQIPAAMETMKANLEPPLPLPFVETGARVLGGFAGYMENTVPGLFADVTDVNLRREFSAANDAAAEAIRDASEWLEAQKETANNDYALGEETFLRMLETNEGLTIGLAELKAAGEYDLQRNLDALDAACAEFAPGESAQDCVLKVQNRKPPEGAVGGAQRQLPSLKQFLIDNDIVSIPSDEEALVAEAPPHRRFNAAYINIPGPFETGLPSTYFIAPPDPTWSEADQLAYVPGETDLLAISVHEVWPGHFLNFLHSNRAENRIGKHFSTYSFTEGWAHYTEEMMVEAGLGDGDPEVKIGQLLNALLRNVRYLSAIGLHAEGMTVEESEQMFLEKAFQDPGNARQQANRGTRDPGYLNYTLGKLMIMKLREDWAATRGGRDAWGDYHDAFLSYGNPPIPLIRDQLLDDSYTGDPALLPH